MATPDLDELLQAGKKVYVKNTSRPMGHIVLTFVTPNGRAVPRPIPRTWIPICLTDTDEADGWTPACPLDVPVRVLPLR